MLASPLLLLLLLAIASANALPDTGAGGPRTPDDPLPTSNTTEYTAGEPSSAPETETPGNADGVNGKKEVDDDADAIHEGTTTPVPHDPRKSETEPPAATTTGHEEREPTTTTTGHEERDTTTTTTTAAESRADDDVPPALGNDLEAGGGERDRTGRGEEEGPPCPCSDGRAPDPPSRCTGGRTTPDPACPCRDTCAGQSGEPCSAGHPCDEEFGLRCGVRNDTCTGPLSVRIFNISHHSAKVTWGMSLSELQPQALVSYSTAYRGIHTQWSKVGDTKPIVMLENLLPNQNYYLKVEEDGKQEISTFRTKEDVPMPKILIKQRSQTTLTVVWDDFRLPGYGSEYVLEYRAASNHNWTRVQAGTQTTLTLIRLMPDTPYRIKVSVQGEDEDGELQHQSEVITAHTADGCVRDDHSYGVGDAFFVGCDLHCVCGARNTTDCGPRCVPPLVRIGSSETTDPGCHKKIIPSNPCCAILHCTAESETNIPPDVCEHVYCGPNAKCVSLQKACICSEGYIGNPHDLSTGCIAVNSSSGGRTQPEGDTNEHMPSDDSRNELAGDPKPLVVPPSTDVPFQLDLRPPGSNGNQSVLFDGCQYNNLTYDRGVHFEDGCDALCVCKGAGRVSCTPRCNALLSGPACKEVPDPDDPCCRITLCSLPGHAEESELSPEVLPMRIVSALAHNGTSVRIQIVSVDPPSSLEVWFSSDKLHWQRSSPHSVAEVRHGVFEVEADGLMPQTDYFLRVGIGGHPPVSNTVTVKTFPAAVNSLSEVCIHHNRSYEVGETFDEGCEHRCVCREHGFIECRNRCALYVDAVGYEGCEWTESEEDPCCSVPICHNNRKMNSGSPPPPGGDPFCVASGEVYRAGDIWESGDGCRTTICRCARLPDGSTAVQCQSECPPLPPNAHIPTARCPRPVLVKPSDGPCRCPRVECEQRILPTRGGTEVSRDGQQSHKCDFKGERHEVGHEFHDGCLALCRCMPDFRVECATIECPYHFGAEFTECLEWDIDPDFFPMPPRCCAPAKCKNDGSCTFGGLRFRNFEDIPSERLPCGARCVCVNGNVTCKNRCPPLEDAPPVHLPCPPDRAHKRHADEDACCLRWTCEKPEEDPEGVDEEEQQQQIQQQQLHRVSVSALNSTAVRVRFSLSGLLVGLVGHAELHFTTDPHLPASQWHVQKFSRPKRLFDSPNIEYVLNALRPDTTYFLRVHIKIDALQGTNPESRLFKLKMPPAEGADDYRPRVSVVEDGVGTNHSDFRLSGIPDPIPRHVHVIKIMYRTLDGEEEQRYSFKVPNDTRRITLDHLKPGKRYLAQLELYLTDGRTLTSNEVEFVTREVGGVHNASKENAIGDGSSNEAELLLQSGGGGGVEEEQHHRAYFVALVVVAVVAAVAGFGFVLLLVLLVRRQASAKAPISRTPSESAYDNPTYKTYDGERPEDKSGIQTTQA